MTSGIDNRGPQETGPHANPADEAGIEELLRQVGVRDEPDADMMQEVVQGTAPVQAVTSAHAKMVQIFSQQGQPQ